MVVEVPYLAVKRSFQLNGKEFNFILSFFSESTVELLNQKFDMNSIRCILRVDMQS